MDTASPHERPEFVAAATRAFLQITEVWQLTDVQCVSLLACALSESTITAWRAAPPPRMDWPTLQRVSLTVSIYEALARTFRRAPELHITWLTMPGELAPFRWSLHLCVRGGFPDAPSSRCLSGGLS